MAFFVFFWGGEYFLESPWSYLYASINQPIFRPKVRFQTKKEEFIFLQATNVLKIHNQMKWVILENNVGTYVTNKCKLFETSRITRVMWWLPFYFNNKLVPSFLWLTDLGQLNRKMRLPLFPIYFSLSALLHVALCIVHFSNRQLTQRYNDKSPSLRNTRNIICFNSDSNQKGELYTTRLSVMQQFP